ncbi:MAG: CBS domain-containing protein [Anaerolineae bacterium]
MLALMVLEILALVLATSAAGWLAASAGWQWNFGRAAWPCWAWVLVVLVTQVVARALAMRSTEKHCTAAERLCARRRSAADSDHRAADGVWPVSSLGRSGGRRQPGQRVAQRGGPALSDQRSAEEPGLIEEDEKKMIASIFELGETVAREVMVPRIDVVAVDERTTLRQALDVIIQAGHSRIPVYRGSIDNVQGVLYAKDLLLPFRDGRERCPRSPS